MAYNYHFGKNVDWSKLKDLNSFNIEEMLRDAGILNYFELKEEVYKSEWKQFFANGRLTATETWTTVNGVDINVSEGLLRLCTGCEDKGRNIMGNSEWMTNDSVSWKDVEDQLYNNETADRRAESLKPQARILHYLLNQVFFPRGQPLNIVYDYEKEAMWNILRGTAINLPNAILKHIRQHMVTFNEKKTYVYGMLVTRILKVKSLDLSKATGWKITDVPTLKILHFSMMNKEIARTLKEYREVRLRNEEQDNSSKEKEVRAQAEGETHSSNNERQESKQHSKRKISQTEKISTSRKKQAEKESSSESEEWNDVLQKLHFKNPNPLSSPKPLQIIYPWEKSDSEHEEQKGSVSIINIESDSTKEE